MLAYYNQFKNLGLILNYKLRFYAHISMVM